MFTALFVGNVVKKSALRKAQVAGKTTPVIDIRIAARNGGQTTHFVKCVVWGNDALAVSEHLEVGRTVLSRARRRRRCGPIRRARRTCGWKCTPTTSSSSTMAAASRRGRGCPRGTVRRAECPF